MHKILSYKQGSIIVQLQLLYITDKHNHVKLYNASLLTVITYDYGHLQSSRYICMEALILKSSKAVLNMTFTLKFQSP